MVIDDLADRPHDADLLLDQTLGRAPSDYDRLLPGSALRLTGAGYALLRPEFGAGRQAALTCRAARGFRLRQLLIAPGGVDADDASGRLLDLLAEMELPEKLNVTVALGPTAPHLDALRARRLPFRCDVRAGERDMAGLMASADLCIGAAGVSLLERCALGLPSLLVVLAENQERPTRQIVARGAAIALGAADDPALDVRLARALARSANPEVLAAMSAAAGGLCDGAGTARVADALIQFGTV